MSFFRIRGIGVDLESHVLTIASGATTATTLDLQSKGFVGMQIPSAFTGTAVTFTGSMDGTTFVAIYNSENSAYSVTVSASRYYILNPADFLGARYVRIVSNGAEGDDRTIIASTRSFQ